MLHAWRVCFQLKPLQHIGSLQRQTTILVTKYTKRCSLGCLRDLEWRAGSAVVRLHNNGAFLHQLAASHAPLPTRCVELRHPGMVAHMVLGADMTCEASPARPVLQARRKHCNSSHQQQRRRKRAAVLVKMPGRDRHSRLNGLHSSWSNRW
eukprot:6485924-Amphidinium_carterae.1